MFFLMVSCGGFGEKSRYMNGSVYITVVVSLYQGMNNPQEYTVFTYLTLVLHHRFLEK